MTAQTAPVRDYDYLRIVIDDGSGRLKVAGQHVPAGANPSDLGVDFVQLQAGYSTLDQKFLKIKTLNGQDRLLQGDDEVTAWINDNPLQKHKVIDGHKLVLFDQYKNHPASCGFFKSIGSPRHGDMANVQDFTALRYKTIREGILLFYKNRTAKGLGRGPEYWDSITIEAMITVPALWGRKACSILKNAATDAGFSSINLRLEPLCAAALNMQALFKEGRVQDGVTLAFCDTGHLTNDRAAVKYTIGPDQCPQLVIVGKPHGDAYGSHYINHLACDYVKSCAEVAEHGGLDEVLRRLGGLPAEAFTRQVSHEIEFRKKEHPRDFVISVTGMNAHRTVDQGIGHIYINISRARMQDFLNQWAAKVVESDKQWLNSPMFHTQTGTIIRGLVVTGGGGRERTLQRARTQELQHLVTNVYHDHADRDHEVAEGGMRRYPTNTLSKLQYGHFYIERGQPVAGANARKSGKKSLKRKRGRGQTNTEAPEPTIDDNRDITHVPKGYLMMKRLPSEPIITKTIPMRFEIDQAFGVSLEFFLYHSQTSFPNGVSLRDENGNLREEFELLDVPFAFPDVNWEQYEGRVDTYERDGSRWYDIMGLVRMEVSDDHLDLVVTLIEPGEELQYDRSGNVKTAVKYRAIAELRREIWDAARTSHIPEDMTPAANLTTPAASLATPELPGRYSMRKRNPLGQSSNPSSGSPGGAYRKSTKSTTSYAKMSRQAKEKLKICYSDCDDDEEPLPSAPPTVDKDEYIDENDVEAPAPAARQRSNRDRLGRREAIADLLNEVETAVSSPPPARDSCQMGQQ